MARSKSIGSLFVALGLNDKKFKAGLKNAGAQLSAFAATSAKYAAAGAVVAGTAIAAVMVQAVEAASDLQETTSKSQAVFGESAADVQAWAKTAANAFGQSSQQALEAASTIGNMMKAMGMADEESAKMSKTIVELASDLASFNNTTIDDAIQAINAALRGESEPIRRYGVLLDDATLKAEAFSKGLYSGKGALTPQAKALSAYNVILRQTTTAQGDFARTSDGLANSQRILQAQLANTLSGLGQGLLPAIQAITNALKAVDTQAFGEKIGNIIGKFAQQLVLIVNDGSAWELLVLNAELAFMKILNLPVIKQLTELMQFAVGGFEMPDVQLGGKESQDLVQKQINDITDRLAQKYVEGQAALKNAQTAPPIAMPEAPAPIPEPAKKTKDQERIEIDNYAKRGLAMTSTPGSMQDKILKVQESIRDILKEAKIQDKQLVWQ
jgi:hypothetical protein